MNSNYSDLDWLAFCYVTGELDEADHLAMESRLETEQAAREAVARAVELYGALAAPMVTPQPQHVRAELASERRQWWQPAAWISVGVAACLLVILSVEMLRTGDRNLAEQDPAVQSASGELALAWSQVRNDHGDELSSPGGSGESEMADAVDAQPLILADDAGVQSLELDGETAAPSWLLSALAEVETAPSGASEESEL